jgi:hypothetical protein
MEQPSTLPILPSISSEQLARPWAQLNQRRRERSRKGATSGQMADFMGI